MKMKKTYYLNKDVLPTIPVPHDCIIKKIRIEHKWLIFTFDNDTSYIRQNTRKITKLPRKRLEYLYHNVGYCSIITKLHLDAPVMIDAGVDYLVYEWIE